MLKAQEVQDWLRQYEPLREVLVEESSQLVYAPWLVRVHGLVWIYGETHAFETDLDLREFGSLDDLNKLAAQLLKSFAAAGEAFKAASSV